MNPNNYPNRTAKLFTRWMAFVAVVLITLASTAVNAQNVNVTSTGGTATATYATVSAAFTAVNAGTHTGAITMNIVANTSEPGSVTALASSGTGSASYTSVLIRPFGGSYTIGGTVTASRAIIELNGADNVTIDGDDPSVAGARNLTIGFSSTAATIAACIRVSSASTLGANGADNNTIKNCIITGNRVVGGTTTTYGINMSNYSTTSLSTGGYSSLNNRFENNLITRCAKGIWAVGASATYNNVGTKISGNVMGDGTAAGNIGTRGVLISYSASSAAQTAAQITNNDIQVGDPGTTGYSTTIAGIELGTVNFGTIVTGNKLHDIYQPSTAGYGSIGLYITGATSTGNITIANNFIYRIAASNYAATRTSTFINHGVLITAGATNLAFDHNTVVMNTANATGTLVNPASNALCVTASGTTFSSFRNNILTNTIASTNALCIYTTATTNISGASMNNNCFYAPSGVLGYYNAADRSTLSAWQSATGKDANSYSINPNFISATDPHLNGAVSSLLESGGAAGTGITSDLDGDSRPGPIGSVNGGGTAPDVGADEYDGLPIQPVAIASVSASPTGNLCTAASRSISANVTAGTNPVTSVTLNYSLNGTAQTPISMTNTSGSTWEATIAAAANAAVTWSVTAVDAVVSVTSNGTGYQDEALTGVTAYANASLSTVCSGSPTILTAYLDKPGTSVLGSGASTSTSGTNFLYSLYGGQKSQYIIRAADLIAGGFTRGPITSLAYEITALATTPTALQNFSVTLNHTDSAQFTAANILSNAGSPNYTSSSLSSVVGVNTLTFSSPFQWNGTSNILVTICHYSGGAGASATTPTMKVYTNAYTTTCVRYENSQTGICNYTGSALPSGWTGSSFTSTSRPIFTLGGSKAPAITGIDWSDGTSSVGTSNDLSVSPIATTTYTVTATISGGCTATASAAVTALTLPTAPTATNSSQCGLGVPTASVASTTGATTPVFRWYSAATGGTLLQNSTSTTYTTAINTSTDFYVCEYDGACESARTAVSVSVATPPAITISGDVTICAGQSTTLTVSSTGNDPNYSYVWNTGFNGASYTVTPSATTTYSVVATDSTAGANAGCVIASAPMTVTVKPLPGAVTVAPSAVTSCYGAAQTLTASGGSIAQSATFGAGTLVNLASSTTSAGYPAPFGNYYQGARHQFLFTAAELAAAGLAGNLTSLAFDVLTPNTTALSNFTVSVGTTSLTALTSTLSGGLTTVYSAASYTPSATGGYANNTITFATPFAWNGTSNIIVETCFNNSSYAANAVFNQTATAFVSSAVYRADVSTVCSGTTATYTYSQRPNMRFTSNVTNVWSWSPNTASTAAVSVSPVATTTYTATSTINGCSASGTATITVNPELTLTNSSTNVSCNAGTNGTADVVAAGGNGTYSYNWSNGGTTASLTGLSAGTYNVTVTDGLGCTATASVTVSQPSALSASAVPAATLVCGLSATTPVVVTAAGGTTPYTGEGTFTQSAGTTVYSVTDANGCIASASVTIATSDYVIAASVTGPGSVFPTGSTTVVCGDNQTYTIAPTSSCDTITDVLVDGVSIGAVTTYTFSNVTAGHTISASFGTYVYPMTATAGTNGSVTGAATAVCGTNVSYTITPDACYQIADVLVDGVSVGAVGSYTFSNVTAAHTISATFSIISYTLTATSSTGGSISPSGSVSVDCGNSQAFTVTADPGNNIDSLLVNGVNVGAVATYTVTNVTGNGTIAAYFSSCSNPATATAPATAAICSGTDYVLSGSFGGGATSATWSTSGTGTFDNTAVGTGTIYTPSAADIAAGTVTLTLTTNDPDGTGACQIATASTVVTINTTPTVNISGNLAFCAGGSTTLTANATAANAYLWNGGSTNTSITVTAGGSYSVTVTGAGSCSASASVTVVENALPANPVVSASGATTFCTGGSVTLSSDYTGGNLWSNGATTDAITVSASGSFTVTHSDVNGCSATSAATSVTVNASSASISGLLGICSGGSTTLTASASPAAVSYAWGGGETTAAITASVSGTYSVTTTDANGCTAVASATVIDASSFTASISSGCANWVVGNSTTLTASASVAGTYTYAWSGGGTSATKTVTAVGTYTVTVTDAFGCSATASFTLGGTPLNGTYTIGSAGCGNFSTLANALAHHNAYGVSGNVIFDVPAGYTEAAPSGSIYSVTGASGSGTVVTYTTSAPHNYVVGQEVAITGSITPSTFAVYGVVTSVPSATSFTFAGTTTGSSTASTAIASGIGGFKLESCLLAAGVQTGPSQTLTIRKSGSGANPILTHGVGTTANADGVFVIQGADNVTIDGIDIQEPASNTTATTRAEWAYAVLKCDGSNGSNDVTIQNCNIALTKAYTSNYGVYVAGHGYDNVGVGYNVTTVTGTAQASRNKALIQNNNINNVYQPIRLNGNPSSIATTGESLNDSLHAIINNTLTNWAGSSTGATGIYYANNRKVTIRNNTINGTTGTTATLYGINASSGGWADISRNTITLDGSSSTYGINLSLSAGTATNPNIVKVDSNLCQNFINRGTSLFYGIYGSAGGDAAQVSLSYNTYTGHTQTSTGAVYGFYLFGTALNGTLNQSYNSFSNNNFTTSTGTIYGIYGGQTTGNMTFSNNTANNNILNQAGGTVYLIYTSSSSTATIANNQVRNNRRNVLSTATTVGATYGFYLLGSHATSSLVNNNVVDSLYHLGMPGTTTTTMYGIYLSNTSPGQVFRNNQVTNLFTTGASTGNQSMWGMYIAPSGANAVFRNNIVSGIRSAATQNGVIYGMQLAGSTTAGTRKDFAANTISNLSAGGSTGNIRGIQISGGTEWYVYNNAISRISASLSAPASIGQQVLGVDISATTATNAYFLYNNSIYLTGNGGGVNFATSGIHANSGPALTLVNNLVINNITPGTSANTVAFRRSSGTAGTAPASYQVASDNNLFYAGTPGATRLIYGEGVTATPTNSMQTLAAYKTFMATRDQNSRTEASTPFVNAATDSLLHIAASPGTFVESGGKPYPTVALANDIDGGVRSALAPDIGADEGNFTSLVPQITVIAASPATGQCTAVAHAISTTVVAGGSAITGVTLNYAYNGTAQTPIAMTNTSGNIWEATIPAATPVNALVTWSVLATDGTYSSAANGTSYRDAYLTAATTAANATPSTLCLGSSTSLLGGSPNTASTSIGSASTLSASSGYPSAGGNYWYQDWQQFVYTAAELSAAGIMPGNISGLRFDIGAAASPAAVAGYSISLGAAASSTVTGFQTTGLTPVYGPTTFTTTAGLVTLNFTTPYYWNGTSNIVVDVRGTGAYSSANATVKYTATATNTVAFSYTSANNSNFWTSNPTPTLSANRPNIAFLGVIGPIGFTTSWSDGSSVIGTGNPLLYTPAAVGSYSYMATFTDANGCSYSSTPVTVTVNDNPVTPTVTNSSQCGLATPSFVATGSGTAGHIFRWYLDATGGTPLASQSNTVLINYPVSATDSFYVSEYNPTTGCESGRAMAIVTVSTPDPVTAITSAATVCPATFDNSTSQFTPNVTLSVNVGGSGLANYTFDWFRGTTYVGNGSPQQDAPFLPGTYVYSVQANDAAAGCATSSTVTVVVEAPPSITSVTSSASSVCAGGSVTLTATNIVSGPNTQPTGYCADGGSTTTLADEQIFGFTFGSMSNIQTETCASNYGNYTATIPAMVVNRGDVIPFSVITNECDGATFFSNGCSIWIDFNRDGDWADAGERVYTTTATTLSPNTRTGTITIPATASLGVTRMRVFVLESTASPADPCAAFSYGEKEDYLINIQVAGPTLNWSWSDGTNSLGTGASITVANAATTTYTVTASNPAAALGCTNSGTVNVTALPVPVAPTATNSVQCGSSVPTAYVIGTSGDGSSTFRWYNDAVGGTAIAGETDSLLTSLIVTATDTFYVSEVYAGTPSCEGARAMVIVEVTTPDPIAITNTAAPYCVGSPITLSVANTASTPANNYTFTWTASSVDAGLVTTGANATATPVAAGTYTYTATGVDGICQNVAYFVATVSANPLITKAVASPVSAVCAGTPVTLTAQSIPGTAGTVTVGSGTLTSTVYGPYYGFYGGAKRQYLFTAAELQALNLAEGDITSLGFNITAHTGPYTFNGFQISMKSTTATALTSTYVTGLTQVFGPTAVTLPGGATVTNHVFNTPFYWNGTSNVVVEICWTNNDGGGSSANSATSAYTTTSSIRCIYSNIDNSTTVCATATGTTSTLRANVIFGGIIGTNVTNTLDWSWSPGSGLDSNIVTVTPASTTTYTVVATNAAGCTSSDTVNVNVLPLPAAPTAVDNTICGFNPANVSVVSTTGATSPVFAWYLDAVGGSAITGQTNDSLEEYYVSSQDTFYVSEFDGNCYSPRTAVVQNVTLPDAVTASVSDANICLPGVAIDLTSAQTGSTNSYTYAWTAIPPSGSGLSGVQLGPVTTLFSNDFTSSVLPSNVTVAGNASITGGVLQVNPNALSQSGAVQITAGGNAADTIAVTFDLIVPQNGADGVSYSYCNDGVLTGGSLTNESGTGTKLAISFDSYTNGANTAGIYVTYPPVNQPVSGGTGVLAYSSDVSWRASAAPVQVSYNIGTTGLLNLSLNGVPVFTNVQLPAAYVTANKSSWSHFFKARTGGVSEEHSIDNMTVKVAQIQSLPTPGQNITVTPTVAGNYVYQVTATDGACATISTVSVTVNDPAPAILAGSDVTVCDGGNVTLNSSSAGLIPALRFSEVLWQVNAGTGNTGAGIPSWTSTWYNANGGTTMDMIEITNLGSSQATSAGVTIEMWNSASTTSGLPAYVYTIPATAPLMPAGGLLYFTHSGSTTVTDLTNNFYARGISSIDNGSGTAAGMIMRKNGVLIDAVATSGYTFPAAAGITAADWSGSLTSNSGLSGSILVAADNNTASAWVNTSALQTASVGTLNTGLVANLPSLGTVSWTSIPSGFTGTQATSTFGPITAVTSFVVSFDNGTCQSYDTVVVTPLSFPDVANITASVDSICTSGSATYTAINITQGASVQWQYYNTATSSWTNITDSTRTTLLTGTIAPVLGDSTIIYRLLASCGVNSTASRVDTLQILKPFIASVTNDTVCGTGIVDLAVVGNGTINWYSTSTSTGVLYSGATLSDTIVSNTVFWVRANVGTCLDPAGRQPVYGVVNPAPEVSITASQTICNGEARTLIASSALDSVNYYTYTWTPGGVVNDSITVTPSTTTTYTVEAVGAGGCNTFATSTVNVNPLPNIIDVTVSEDTICNGSSTTLTLNEGNVFGPQSLPAGYCADGGSTTTLADEQIFGFSMGSISNLNQGETCTSNYTDYTSTIAPLTVSLGQTLGFSLVTDECDGVTYYSSGMAIYIDYNRDGDWDDSGELAYTTTATTVSPNTRTGNITIPTTANLGWTRMRVKVQESVANPLPCAAFSYGEVEDYIINISGAGGTYVWQPGNLSGQSVTVSPSVSTDYTVTVTNVFGCTGTSSAHVEVLPFTAPSITASGSTTLCTPETVTLDAGAGYDSYSWSDGTTQVATTQSFTTGVAGIYSVTVANLNGCSATVSDTVTVYNFTTPVINASKGTICTGADSSTFSLTSAYAGYLWSTGATSPTITVGDTGTYSVTVTSVDGCTGTASFTLTGSPAPIAPVINDADVINYCFDGVTPGSYLLLADGWGQSVSWNDPGGSTDEYVFLNVGNGPGEYPVGTYTIIITAQGSGGCIAADSVTFNVLATTASTTTEAACNSYDWNGTTYTASGTYTYTVTAGNAQGCDSVATLVLTINTPSSSTTTEAACNSYTWNGTTYTASGTYTWNGTDANGCDSTATLELTINTPSTSTSTETACDSLVWNGTTYTASGTYTWSGTNAAGCDSTATLVLTIDNNCGGSGVTLNLNMFLQGYMDLFATSPAMVPVLANQLVVGAVGTETDTVTVTLYDAISTSTVIESVQGILMTDGTLSATFANASAGSDYYIGVTHRNSLEVWSAAPVTFTAVTSYNFTTSLAQAWSIGLDPMVEVSTGVFALWTGDLNQDDFIDASDFIIYDTDNAAGLLLDYYATDMNGDGFVDASDFTIYDYSNSVGPFFIQP